MCAAELALSKMYNDRKDRKARQRNTEVMSGFANAKNPHEQPIDKKKPAEKTKMNTGIKIGGQY